MSSLRRVLESVFKMLILLVSFKMFMTILVKMFRQHGKMKINVEFKLCLYFRLTKILFLSY
jgi:hypothetical protein